MYSEEHGVSPWILHLSCRDYTYSMILITHKITSKIEIAVRVCSEVCITTLTPSITIFSILKLTILQSNCNFIDKAKDKTILIPVISTKKRDNHYFLVLITREKNTFMRKAVNFSLKSFW